MRTPGRRTRRRQISVADGVDLSKLARRVRYVGSAEHKTYPSPTGAPRPRADATKCDPALHGDFQELTRWLSEAVAKGQVAGPWEGEFPRYVWVNHGGSWFEGRLVNREQGTYKGWEISVDELPEGL